MLVKQKLLAAMAMVLVAMLVVVACGGEEEEDKATITFGDLNWASALLQNRIAQYIVEHGYGYPTDVKFGATLPLFEGLQRGDTDVTMEIWLPNQDEAWDKARSEGAVLSVGQSLGSDWQSAFVIPAYLQEQYPDLDSVDDLKDQQYKDLFTTAETGDKARLVSCIIGWACEEVNAAQIEGYGLLDHVEIVNPRRRGCVERRPVRRLRAGRALARLPVGHQRPRPEAGPGPAGRAGLQRPVLVHHQGLRLRGCQHPHRGESRPCPGRPPTSWRCCGSGTST